MHQTKILKSVKISFSYFPSAWKGFSDFKCSLSGLHIWFIRIKADICISPPESWFLTNKISFMLDDDGSGSGGGGGGVMVMGVVFIFLWGILIA